MDLSWMRCGDRFFFAPHTPSWYNGGMSKKFFDIVRIIKGFYKGQLGIVVDKGSSHAGRIGDDPGEVYQIMIKTGAKIIDVDDKDLQIETAEETKEESVETGEDIENALEQEPESPEEELDESIENKPEFVD